MSDAPLVDQVQTALRTHRLLTSGARVIVAVSGGSDSMALLHALLRVRPAWRLALHVAHLNHGLRPEAAGDAAFVRERALRWKLPVTIHEEDVAARCRDHGWSLEDGARRLRYAMLTSVAAQQSADAVAVAHTADDQAETVLMRLMRGTGLMGLGAIPVKRPLEPPPAGGRVRRSSGPRVWLIRPLLACWRSDIAAYLRAERVPHREDASNRDCRFLRNRVRHQLLPMLQREYNPNIKGLLTQLAEHSRCDYSFLAEAAARQWRRVAAVQPAAAVSLSIPRFLRQPKALQRQLLRQAIEQVKGDVTQVEFRHWREVERAFLDRPEGTVVDLPGGVQVRREAGRVTCRRIEARNGPRYTG